MGFSDLCRQKVMPLRSIEASAFIVMLHRAAAAKQIELMRSCCAPAGNFVIQGGSAWVTMGQAWVCEKPDQTTAFAAGSKL
jgi:hypothetical protein